MTKSIADTPAETFARERDSLVSDYNENVLGNTTYDRGDVLSGFSAGYTACLNSSLVKNLEGHLESALSNVEVLAKRVDPSFMPLVVMRMQYKAGQEILAELKAMREHK